MSPVEPLYPPPRVRARQQCIAACRGEKCTTRTRTTCGWAPCPMSGTSPLCCRRRSSRTHQVTPLESTSSLGTPRPVSSGPSEKDCPSAGVSAGPLGPRRANDDDLVPIENVVDVSPIPTPSTTAFVASALANPKIGAAPVASGPPDIASDRYKCDNLRQFFPERRGDLLYAKTRLRTESRGRYPTRPSRNLRITVSSSESSRLMGSTHSSSGPPLLCR